MDKRKFQKIISFIRAQYNVDKELLPLHSPVFVGNEKKYLNECIDTTFVSSVGKFVDSFEVGIENFTGAKKAVACVNGTAALFLALKIVGVDRESEVITQALTFVATANAITYCGAKPILIDIDPKTLGLSSEKLRQFLNNNVIYNPEKKSSINKKSGKRISAIVPMHTFGHPCVIDEIVQIGREYSIPVIEDAAESLGSFYKGKHTGTFGEVGVLSFNGNKIITTGGGGMLLFNDVEKARRAKHLSTTAKVDHPWEFIHDEVGYNLRLPNINAALGLAQLERIDEILEVKRNLAESYLNFFNGLNVPFMKEPENSNSNYWLNTIFLNSKKERDEFLKLSNANQVMTRPGWTLIHKLEMYKDCQTDELESTFDISDKLVNIPSSVNTKG